MGWTAEQILTLNGVRHQETSVANPWLALPSTVPYVLPEDRLKVEAFNAKLPPTSLCRLDVETVIPEPFIGAVTSAPVVVLQLNPGFDPVKDPDSHADPQFRTVLFANLRHEQTAWPFHFFDPRFRDSHPGGRWWKSKTKKLAEAIPLEHLAQRSRNRMVSVQELAVQGRVYRPQPGVRILSCLFRN